MVDLKGFREDKKIKQKELCELLGIAQPYLSAIERGERPLSKTKFTLLHKHFGDIIFNYKNADIIIERKGGTDEFSAPSPNREERSRFLSIIEGLQKTIDHQQGMLTNYQDLLRSKK